MTKATRRGQLLIVVSLLASLLLASCGGGATPAPTAVPTSPPEPTEAPEPTPAPTATPEPALIEQGSELAILANHISERLADWTPTMAADALFDNLNDGDDSNDPYILDIRSAEDYATGHIPGAVNVGGGALFDADTLDDLPTEGQVVVTCYSGQTAGQVVSVLNLLGYDAYSLKFGMPSWAILTESGLWRDAMSMGYPTETEAHQLP